MQIQVHITVELVTLLSLFNYNPSIKSHKKHFKPNFIPVAFLTSIRLQNPVLHVSTANMQEQDRTDGNY